MSKRSAAAWLADIIRWGERLERHLDGVDWIEFSGNELVQDAVVNCLENIGEAAGRLDDLNPELAQAYPELSLKQARRARDRLSHGYYRIDLSIVWTTAIESVPNMVAAARLAGLKYDNDSGQHGAS